MTTERDNELVEAYLTGRTIDDISRTYGLSQRRIHQILDARGVKRTKRRVPGEVATISKLHQKIGLRVYNYYYDRGLTRVQAADKLGISPVRLRRIELGAADLELLMLQDLSRFLGITVGELVDG